MRLSHLAPLAASLLFGAATARAQPSETGDARFAVIVGANFGNAGDEPLLYAEQDAKRVREVLASLGQVSMERALLVNGGSPQAVLEALAKTRAQIAALTAAGKRAVLLFYFSGHGDEESLHLADGDLALAHLRDQLAQIPSTVTLAVLDACRTPRGAKGISRGPSVTLAADAPRGTVEIRASATGEAAQESHELGGSLFTHFLVSGMRGGADVDRNGRVTLAELYSYVYGRTLLRSTQGAALQHPTLDVNLSGAGDLVLSYPAHASAFLSVPGGADRYLVFARGSSSVVGELSGEGALNLAVPPGQYLVARRRGSSTSVAEVDLGWGGVRELTSDDFRPVSREQLAARGGGLELRPWQLGPHVGAELRFGGAEEVALQAGAELSWRRGALIAGVDANFVTGTVSTAAFGGQQRALTGGPYVGYQLHLSPISLAADAGLEMRWAWLHLERAEADRLRAASIPVDERRAYGAIGPRVGVRLSLPLAARLSISLEGSASLLLRREVSSDGTAEIAARPVVCPRIAVAWSF
ncbi:MAG: caspase family protein [Deltaproteobacteria bacterium]|nr:caspase family protein [Deltaproteobacteria bacterium]